MKNLSVKYSSTPLASALALGTNRASAYLAWAFGWENLIWKARAGIITLNHKSGIISDRSHLPLLVVGSTLFPAQNNCLHLFLISPSIYIMTVHNAPQAINSFINFVVKYGWFTRKTQGQGLASDRNENLLIKVLGSGFWFAAIFQKVTIDLLTFKTFVESPAPAGQHQAQYQSKPSHNASIFKLLDQAIPISRTPNMVSFSVSYPSKLTGRNVHIN